jgi:hypothetical protein
MVCLFGYCLSWTFLRYYVLGNYWPELSILGLCGLGICLGLVDIILKRKRS